MSIQDRKITQMQITRSVFFTNLVRNGAISENDRAILSASTQAIMENAMSAAIAALDVERAHLADGARSGVSNRSGWPFQSPVEQT